MIDDAAIAARILGEFPDTAVAYRFGSTATGDDRPGSDIDLAFLPSHPVDPLRRFALQEALAAFLRRDVDLVDLSSASTVLQMQVLGSAIPILVADENRRNQFEDQVFCAYPRLNEERRGILDDIQRTGRVHGG